MPDLSAVLAGLGGQGATVFQATVGAVTGSTASIVVSGGTFTEVPYILGTYGDNGAIFGPVIGQQVYVLGQENWGMVIIGAAAGANRDVAVGQTGTMDPSSIGSWTYSTTYPNGRFAAAGGGGTMHLEPNPGGGRIDTALWFYDLGAQQIPGGTLSAVTFLLDVGAVDMSRPGVVASDSAYITMGLTDNYGLTDPALQLIPNFSASFRINTFPGITQLTLPLLWGSKLLNGTATGVYLQSQDYPMDLDLSGTLTLSIL
jgi:hypothetical protein